MMISKIKQPEHFKAIKRWKFIIAGIIVMLMLGTVYSYSVFRLALEKELQIGATQSGMPYMVSLAVFALFMYFTGRQIDKFHPRTILICGAILVSLGWILSSFATNIFMLTLTYGLISGAGVGIMYGVPMSVISKWFPDKKGLAVGLVLAGFGFSPILTAPVARLLVHDYGVMNAFLILGLGFSVILPMLAFAFKYPTEQERSVYAKTQETVQSFVETPLRSMINTVSFKVLYVNFIIGTMVGLTMIGMTTNVGVDYFKLEASTVTGLMAIFAISNGIGRPIFGWITDRYSSRVAMLVSYSMILLTSIGLILITHHIVVFIISFSIFWFNLGAWLAIAPTSTLKLYGSKNYSRNFGLVYTAYGIGAIAGVSTTGVLLDLHDNYHLIFYFIIGLCLFGILITAKYMKDE